MENILNYWNVQQASRRRLCQKFDACRRQVHCPISKTELAQHILTCGKSVSCYHRTANFLKNCIRTFEERRLQVHRPVVCVPLTRHHTACFQWCCEHHNQTEQDQACIVFSDESWFSQSSDCRHQLIKHESGTAYRQENIQKRDQHSICSVMLWASIMINGHTLLYVVTTQTMNGQQYIDEVLLPHVCLFCCAAVDKFVFMHNSTKCH